MDNPTYSEQLFVPRPEEIRDVIEIIEQLIKGNVVDSRTVIFTGERGIGKSWLLAHLQEKITQAYPKVHLFSLNLKESSDQDSTQYVARLLDKFAKEVLGLQRSLGVTLTDMALVLGNELHQLVSQGEVVVILADSVFESDWTLLADLEEYFLGPVSIERNTAIIMTGRGRAYPWRTPELGTKSIIRSLAPFEFEQTRDQIERLHRTAKPPRQTERQDVLKAQELSNGNPLINSQLAINPEEPAAALDRAITEMLNIVPDEEKRANIRTALEALCVLRAFREDRIKQMFEAYAPNEQDYARWTYAETREVREMLTRYAFATWDEKLTGYVITSSPRAQVELYLQLSDPALWATLHCTAYHLYTEWAQKYQRASEFWQAEADYHQTCLDAKDAFTKCIANT